MSAEVETKVIEETKTEEEPKKVVDASPEKKKGAEETTTTMTKEEEKEKEATKGEAAVPAPPPPPRVHKAEFEKDVVYVYQFCRTPVLPSLSAYCLKVESFLRLNGLKYEVSNSK
jgi:hypothetical protein